MAQVDFLTYDGGTGKILRVGQCESTDVAIQGPGTPLAATANLDTDRIVAGAVVAKVSLDTICSFTNAGGWLANGVDTISYGTSLPNPTSVEIKCTNPRFTHVPIFNETSGTLTLTTLAAGDYTITLRAFPYLDKIITVTAS